jgi:hypothetical protein
MEFSEKGQNSLILGLFIFPWLGVVSITMETDRCIQCFSLESHLLAWAADKMDYVAPV